MRSTRLMRLAAAVVATLFLAAACGGDDDDKPATSGNPAPTTVAAQDIVDTAVAAGGFTVLVDAVKAAGLVETLKGPGPFTVFAPTDQAFADALKALNVTKDQLFADKANLANILKYHVVPGKVMAAEVLKLNGQEVASVAGPKVKVTVAGTNVSVNDAKVTKTDIATSNGVIHVIDKVILPPK